MELSQYGDGAVSVTGMDADARRIQTALLSHGLAGDSTHGMTIQNRVGEILDETEIQDITQEMEQVVAKLCPDVTVAASAVTPGDDNRSVVVGFTLGSNDPTVPDVSFAVVVKKVETRTVVTEFRL